MPLFTYECPVCKARKTAFRPVDQRDFGPLCHDHPSPDGKPLRMDRTLDAPMGIVKGPAVPRGNG